MNYKDLVSQHILSLQDTGKTQGEIARLLGLKNANVVNMHLHQTTSPFPLKRLQLLAKACGLDAYESLVLVNARARDFPDNATEIDQETLFWMIRCTNAARIAVQARKGKTRH